MQLLRVSKYWYEYGQRVFYASNVIGFNYVQNDRMQFLPARLFDTIAIESTQLNHHIDLDLRIVNVARSKDLARFTGLKTLNITGLHSPDFKLSHEQYADPAFLAAQAIEAAQSLSYRSAGFSKAMVAKLGAVEITLTVYTSSGTLDDSATSSVFYNRIVWSMSFESGTESKIFLQLKLVEQIRFFDERPVVWAGEMRKTPGLDRWEASEMRKY